MPLELLAIARADAVTPPQLRRVAIAGLAAVAAETALSDAERLGLIKDLMSAASILPARRGVSGDPAVLAPFLAGQSAALNAALRKVGGHVEVVATVTLPPDMAADYAPPGQARSRAAEAARRAARDALVVGLAVDLLAGVRALARDTIVRGWKLRDGLTGADACALVTPTVAADVITTLQEAARRLEGARVKVSGPLPAFSFSDLALAGRTP